MLQHVHLSQDLLWGKLMCFFYLFYLFGVIQGQDGQIELQTFCPQELFLRL